MKHVKQLRTKISSRWHLDDFTLFIFWCRLTTISDAQLSINRIINTTYIYVWGRKGAYNNTIWEMYISAYNSDSVYIIESQFHQPNRLISSFPHV